MAEEKSSKELNTTIASLVLELGLTYISLGNPEDALRCYNESLVMYGQINKDHPKASWILRQIGTVLRNQGDLTKAVTYLTESLNSYRRYYHDQPEHPEIHCSKSNLASANSFLGNDREAVRLYN